MVYVSIVKNTHFKKHHIQTAFFYDIMEDPKDNRLNVKKRSVDIYKSGSTTTHE